MDKSIIKECVREVLEEQYDIGRPVIDENKLFNLVRDNIDVIAEKAADLKCGSIEPIDSDSLIEVGPKEIFKRISHKSYSEGYRDGVISTFGNLAKMGILDINIFE